ncbi:hypothetical protein Q1695_002483 [Nippostrongylus brasiliensis]|nr:hypothetical protein Q1695_002483 [Nippostrongylus brasiliensis]
MTDEPVRTLKCVLVGDAAVGKTSLIVSYTTNGYPQHYVPTAFDNYSVVVRVDKKPIRLQLCDTAGQSSFDSLRPLSYPDADVFVVVYSVVDPQSFTEISAHWLPEINRGNPVAQVLLVGTQVDLRWQTSKDTVSTAKGRQLASQIGAEFFECSALTQHNLKQVFIEATMMFEQQNATVLEDNGSDAIPVLSTMLSEKLKCKPSHDRIGTNLSSTFIMEEIATDVNSDGVVSLRTVRNFLEELIFTVQKSQNKLIVSWDSVCKRFYDMMSSDDCPDEDIALLGRYQLSMPFFQYQLDEKVLEAWTGLDDVVEVFSLPEFEGFECFREVRPPHSLMITVSARLCSPCLEKVSVAVSTEDLVAPLAESPELSNYALFLNVDSKLDDATSLDNGGAEDGGDSQQKKCLDSGIEHSTEN